LDERIKGLLLHDEYGLFKKNLYLIWFFWFVLNYIKHLYT
jgi:hypothetical protein